MKTLKRIGKYINKYYSTFLGTAIVIIFVSLIFFALYPFQIAEFKKININGTVQVGGKLEYTNDYCQNVGKGIPREISRFLIPKDSNLVSPVQLSGNPTDETSNDAGCRVSKLIKIPIDSSIPPGEYKLVVKVKYGIFPFRWIPVQGESKYFNIEKPDVSTLIQSVNSQLEELNTRIKKDETPLSNVSPISPELKIPIQPNTTPQEPITEPEVVQPEPNTGIIERTLQRPIISIDELLKSLGIK